MVRMTQSQRENARSRKKAQEITNGSTFSMLRHDMVNSKEFLRLSHKAKALLVDLIGRYNRANNGDLAIVYSEMKDRGWASENTLRSAIKELLDSRFLIVTRQGGKNKTCSLYALTCFPINDVRDKNGHLKINIGRTRRAPDYWRDESKIN